MGGRVLIAGMTNIKEPLSKLPNLWEGAILQTHIPSQVEDNELSPERGFAEGCTNNEFSGTSWDDWEDLLEISSKDHGDASKGAIVVA